MNLRVGEKKRRRRKKRTKSRRSTGIHRLPICRTLISCFSFLTVAVESVVQLFSHLVLFNYLILIPFYFPFLFFLSFFPPVFGFVELMRRFSTRVLLQQAKPPLLSARAPLPLFVSARSPQASVPRSITQRRSPSPLSQTSKRYCSYRRMCSSRRDTSGSTNVQGREVLPTNVKPQHYDLTLEPNFEKFTYEGTVTIEYVIYA